MLINDYFYDENNKVITDQPTNRLTNFYNSDGTKNITGIIYIVLKELKWKKTKT